VFGIERDVVAQVHVVNGLSAHADQENLVDFAKAIAAKGSLRAIALVHGEDEPRRVLAAALKKHGLPEVLIAKQGAAEKL
jgi:metallo-beta-lactamase family protein